MVTVQVRDHVLEPPEAAAVPSSGREPTRVRSNRRFIDLHRWGSGRSSSRRARAPHGPRRRARAPHGPRPGSAGTRPSLTRDEPRAWAGVGSTRAKARLCNDGAPRERSMPWSETAFRVSPPIAPVQLEPLKGGSVELREAARRSRRVVYRPEPSSEGAGVRGLELEWAERLPPMFGVLNTSWLLV